MDKDSSKTATERFALLLYYQLQARMPRPGTSFHKYSKGRMITNFKMYVTEDGFKLEMSTSVPYSHFAMGYKADGSKRVPRGIREAYNFKTIDECLRSVGAVMETSQGGELYYD